MTCSKCHKEKAEHHLCSECFCELLQLLSFSEPIVKQFFLREQHEIHGKSFNEKLNAKWDSCTKQLAELGNPRFKDNWRYACIINIQPRRNQITVFENNRRLTLMLTAQAMKKLLEIKTYNRDLYMVQICPKRNLIVNVKE